jgi:hypothetical protein
MANEEDANQNKNHSKKIRDGLERAKAKGKKLGRPSIFKSKNDSQIALKAAELRSQGLSWSQIASRLGIGRTTARRLVALYLNDTSVNFKKEADSSMPITNEVDMPESRNPIIISSIDVDILGRLPKSFQIFSKLLEKANDERRKNLG